MTQAATFIAAAVGLIALAALHLLRRDIPAGSTMISRYALGRYGWVMTLCFGALAAASAALFAGLAPTAGSGLRRIGLSLLLAAAVGLATAALFRMDPVSTPPAERSFTGKLHGFAFLVGVPAQLLATLSLSLAFHSTALLILAVVVWISFAAMIAIMLMVGPGKTPDPKGPERFLGLPNRAFIVAFGVWLAAAAYVT